MDACGLNFIVELFKGGTLPQRGAIAEIGAQEVVLTPESYNAASTFVGTFGDPKKSTFILGKIRDQPITASRDLFKSIGWKYMCIDTSSEHGALALDLNYDRVPWRHRRRYDLVTNFGCTEHIANQLNAFKAIHDLAKVNGIMIHGLPSQGFIDHGLVNYTAKFFWRLAEFNNYRAIDMRITATSGPKRIPESFAQTFSAFDREAQMQDMVLWIAFQRTTDNDFVAPFDGTIRSSKLSKRYPARLVKKYNELF